MKILKFSAVAVALFASPLPLLAQESQDPFRIDINNDSVDDPKTETSTEADGANGGGETATAEAEAVTEGSNVEELHVEIVDEAGGAGGGADDEVIETISLEEAAEEKEGGGPGAAGDGEHLEWVTVEIPQIKGSIKIPSDWNRPTADQVLQAVDFVEYPTEADKMDAEMSALSIGRMTFLVTKYAEPLDGLNPGLSLTWESMPLVFEQVPLEARSQGLARVLSTVVMPQLKAKDKGFQLLEGPKTINDEGGGAWVTFRSTHTLKSGGTTEAIVRLYILPARDHIITAQITTPSDREQAEEVLPALWAIFESLSYAK